MHNIIHEQSDYIIQSETNFLFEHSIPSQSELAILIASFEWLHSEIPSWAEPNEIRTTIENIANREAEILLRILEELSPMREVIAQQLISVSYRNISEADQLRPNIPVSLSDTSPLSKTCISLLLSYITRLPLERIIQIGPKNRKTAFLIRYIDTPPVVVRYWNQTWSFIQQRFGDEPTFENNAPLGKLTETMIHRLIGTDYAPYSSHLSILPMDVCERVIPRSDFGLYLQPDEDHSLFLEMVRLAREANPYGTGKYDDWGIGIRYTSEGIVGVIIDFDWSDPQYSQTYTVGDIHKQKPINGPLTIPIEFVPQSIISQVLNV